MDLFKRKREKCASVEFRR